MEESIKRAFYYDRKDKISLGGMEMGDTKTIRNMYTTEIVEAVRQRLGLEYDDESMDHKILNMSKGKVFKHVIEWNGLLGSYDDTIKNWVLDIYDIDLDEEE